MKKYTGTLREEEGSMRYKGYIIKRTKSGNYVVVAPIRWQEHASNIRVVRKWIEAHILEGK
jgi:hypothetical protein